MMPFFSIIIPVYNVALYLRECLDSVLAQTFTGWEAICIDDGSTDDSGAILDEYAVKDPRIRVIHQKNLGVSMARNSALDIASGAWIGFLDSDDVVGANWLLNVTNGIKSYKDVYWVATGHTVWRPEVKVGEKIVYATPQTRCVGLSAAHEEAWRYVGAVGLLCVHFFRRDAIDRCRFNDKVRVKEDTLFVLSAALSMNGYFLELPTADYLYRQRTESASQKSAGTVSTFEFQRELNKLWQKCPSKGQYFTVLSYKNLLHWTKNGEFASKSDVKAVRDIFVKSWELGSLDLASLPLFASLRMLMFICLGYWRNN